MARVVCERVVDWWRREGWDGHGTARRELCTSIDKLFCGWGMGVGEHVGRWAMSGGLVSLHVWLGGLLRRDDTLRWEKRKYAAKRGREGKVEFVCLLWLM
jgi:hypothetical protein